MPHAVMEAVLWAFGLCLGSFLNVVIYRLPAGLSIAKPLRSFCPRCETPIAGWDNIPVISWLLLRGRCRHCHKSISVQYPIVEAATGLLFVLVYHLLFVAGCRVGMPEPTLPYDAGLLAAWLILVLGLIACSAMDIVSYMVDVRITLLVIVGGLVALACWPRAHFLLPVAQTAVSIGMVAAFVVAAIELWFRVMIKQDPDEPEESADVEVSTTAAAEETAATRLAGSLGMIVLLLLTGAVVYAAPLAAPGRGALLDLVAAASLLALFITVVVIGGQQRPADDEIRAAIEEEQPHARRTVLRELLWLLPVTAAGMLAFVLVRNVWPAALHFVAWSPGHSFVPFAGLLFGVKGAIVGALAGWILRIVFTLAFGREAFGVGDIYILAAAGATAGGDIAVYGLLLSVGVALIGWLLGLLMKSTVMIPFGPWLALGFLLALFWNRPLYDITELYRQNLALAWEERPEMVAIGIGLMLVATAGAIVFARLVRKWVAPDTL